MNALNLEATQQTPKVSFDSTSGQLELRGRSIPEDSLGFYKPLYEWLDEYMKGPATQTVVLVELDYFNTSSSKCILDILRRVDRLFQAGNQVVVKWCYDSEDEDMMEAGEDYSDLLEVPFQIEEK